MADPDTERVDLVERLRANAARLESSQQDSETVRNLIDAAEVCSMLQALFRTQSAELARLRSAASYSLAQTKVKALEWKDGPESSGTVWARAPLEWTYQAWSVNDNACFWASDFAEVQFTKGDLAAAKAAAQAHYEQRVLLALETTPIQPVEIGSELMEAVRDVVACAPAPESDTPDDHDCSVPAGALRALESALSAVRPSRTSGEDPVGWRSMDGAPKDGTQFIAIRWWELQAPQSNHWGAPLVYCWHDETACWRSVSGDFEIRGPWMDKYRWVSFPSILQDPP